MNFLKIFFTMAILMTNGITLVDFNKNTKLYDWRIVDDVVMGGKSYGNFKINKEGHAEFYGTVSLENNGGFSSLRHQFDKIAVSQFSKIKIRLKGDGKNYQFRLKPNRNLQYAYTIDLQTSTSWQTVEINFSDLEPTFRGRKLRMENFDGQAIEEIGFLIGNKKAESFSLQIDNITIE